MYYIPLEEREYNLLFNEGIDQRYWLMDTLKNTRNVLFTKSVKISEVVNLNISNHVKNIQLLCLINYTQLYTQYHELQA